MELIDGPRCEASTDSVPGPAICEMAPAPSAPENVWTSSMFPETKSTMPELKNPRPTASGPVAPQLGT